MLGQSSKGDSIKSHVLFVIAGMTFGLLLSELGVRGIWMIPASILALIAFGEFYMFLTDGRSHGQ